MGAEGAGRLAGCMAIVKSPRESTIRAFPSGFARTQAGSALRRRLRTISQTMPSTIVAATT